MKILFCNIAFMNNYMGITEDDGPNNGGSYVTKTKDAGEQWNFLNDNGYCCGFVMNNGERFAIERIDPKAAHAGAVENVTVIWCALNDNLKETVIVGWYEHATVYREYQPSIVTPIHGIQRAYFTKAKAEDCYLLPVDERTFVIGRASKDGQGKGFGQQNYWYAESAYAQSELIPAVSEYLQTQKHKRINRIGADFEDNCADCPPLTDKEKELANTYWDNGEFFKFLPLAYRLFHEENSLDSAYDVAKCLALLHQYDKSIDWYQRIIQIEGENWISLSALPYLYQQVERFEESIEITKKLLSFEETNTIDVKHELYSVIADNLFCLNKITEAVVWLDKILEESTDEELLQHTKEVKKIWISLL